MFKIITIDRDLCAMCGTCVLSCPETVFVQKEKKSIPDIIHEDLCISCGHCVAICPQEAITHRDFPQGSINPINRDILPSPEQIFESLKTRRSIRAFKDKPVEKDLIEQIQVHGALAIGYPKFQYQKWIERRPARIAWK